MPVELEPVELEPVELEKVAVSVPGSSAAGHKELHLLSAVSSNLVNPSFPFVAYLATIVQWDFLDEIETLGPTQPSVSAKLKVGTAE